MPARERRNAVDELIAQAQRQQGSTPLQRRQRSRGRREPAPLAEGWCSEGWGSKEYTAVELVSFWRWQWRKKFHNTDEPPFERYIWKHLNDWIKVSGAALVEAVIEYGVLSWEALDRKYDISSSGELTGPALQILFAYRKAILRDMATLNTHNRKKWGAHWKNECIDEDTSAEFVSL
jgi:hypothetical protein